MNRNLSKAEWEIMSALWAQPNQPISGIIKSVGDKLDWKYTTFATYIKRMEDKGFIGSKRAGRDKLYYAAVDKQQCLLNETQEVLSKIDAGSTADFLLYMVRDSALDQNDKAELMELLDKLRKEADSP